MRARFVVVSSLLALAISATAICTNAHADETADLFPAAMHALAAGDVHTAIDDLEAMADRGVIDPVSSFDRGLAYAARVQAHDEVPGDLGQAVHGFEEARELSTDSALKASARQALGIVREEIARRRARSDESALVDPGVPLGRAIVEIASEDVWSALAFAGAWTLAIALVGRARASSRRGTVAATVAAILGGAVGLVMAMLALAARDERLHLREAIVVTASARPADARHLTLPGAAPVPEGARVQLLDEAQGFAHVRWGTLDAYLPSPALRPLARR